MKKSKKMRIFLRRVISIIKLPEMRILPGQLAFFLVISIIPLIALVGAIGSEFGLPATSIKEMLESVVPSDVINYLIPANNGEDLLSFNMIIFFGAAFILASNGTYSIINTSNEIYKVKDSSELKRRGKAILMTLILVVLFLFLILVPAFGDVLIKIITNSIHSDSLTSLVENTYRVLELPISLFLIYYNLKLLYTIAPDTKISSRSTIPGALFTTIMWLISSKIYAFYVDYFANYNVFYGAMSNILVLLIWVYILAYIFTLGMCFNATGVIQETLRLKKSDIDEAMKKEDK